MEKSVKHTALFAVNIDDKGRKIYSSDSYPDKKFLFDKKGHLTDISHEFEPPKVKMESPAYDMNGDSSNDGVIVSDSIIAQMESAGGLGIMQHLEHVPAIHEDLMPDLSSSFMEDVMEEDEDEDYSLMQHMDIREPLSTLKLLLEQRLGVELPEYNFWLQNKTMLENHKNLVDQCVQGEGLVQVNVQIQTHLKRINIADVLKPNEEYIDMAEEEMKTVHDINNEETMAIDVDNKKKQNVMKWIVDAQFKKDQERLKIPSDPILWSTAHVRHWLQWAVRHFNLPFIKLGDWNMSGKELCKLNKVEFHKKVPKDPGDTFWTHLELLRKCKFVAMVQKEKVPSASPTSSTAQEKREPRLMKPARLNRIVDLNCTMELLDNSGYGSTGNRTGNNGQIQLWQFLLELLTSKEYKNIIQWLETEGEFKLNNPELVAQLWGERKNKPTMNYEKLSRALRYYYDGDMIAKVHGKRFVYKFSINLKQLIGYSALELSRLVDSCI